MPLEMKLRTVIVEDEKLGQQVLTSILTNYCHESIDLLAVAGTVEEAIAQINQHKPQLVFLDITLGPNIEGAFDVLNALNVIDFKVVFSTSSKQTDNILKALNKFGAKKYLLKPLDIDEVIEAVDLIREELKVKSLEDEMNSIKALLSSIKQPEIAYKLQIPVRNGVQYIAAEDIIMLRADTNSTVIFLTNGTHIRTSRILTQFEEQCQCNGFLRTSRSFIINTKHVERYSNEDGGTVYLTCGCTAALSGKYSRVFFEALGR